MGAGHEQDDCNKKGSMEEWTMETCGDGLGESTSRVLSSRDGPLSFFFLKWESRQALS